jgi:hypothetical protein
MAELLITRERLTGTGRTDEDVYAQVGFNSADEYWSDATAAPMGLSKFVHMLAIHFLNPALEGSGDYYKLDLEDALRIALENGEPWFIEVPGKERRIRPRAAATYLLSLPKCEHLVPSGLKDFLRSQSSTARAAKPRHHRARKTELIIEKMRKMDPAKLRAMKQKEMVAVFNAARSTCETARKKVLSIVD